jgi:hypothetical protein
MSASASQANPNTETTSTQTSVQGASGANSPTITGNSGSIVSADPQVALGAINAAATAIQAVLSGNSQLQGQVAQVGAQQQQSNSDLINQVLSQEQQLASYQGTGGGLQNSDNTKYLIFGGIGLAIVVVLAFLFKGK